MKKAKAMDLQSLPIDVQEHILLQLDSAIWLVRASSTCKLWRHIIAGTVFLRRFRCLHEPPVVGHYHNSNRNLRSCPIFSPPPPPTTVASRDLCLGLGGFLPMKQGGTWTVKDSRGNLLLLEMGRVEGATFYRSMFVVEPLARRYEKIASVAAPASRPGESQAFLLNGAKPGEIGISDYRVVCLSLHGTRAGIITPGGSHRKVRTGNDQGKEMLCLGSAAGSMYWYTKGGTVFALDKITAEFSSSSLPHDEDFVQPTFSSKFAVAAGRDGEARIVFLAAGDKFKVFARPTAGSGVWVLEKSVRRPPAVMLGVPADQKFYFGRPLPLSAEAETMGTVMLVASPAKPTENPNAFSLDIEKKHVRRTKYAKAYPIRLPWPPSLRACTITGGDTDCLSQFLSSICTS